MQVKLISLSWNNFFFRCTFSLSFFSSGKSMGWLSRQCQPNHGDSQGVSWQGALFHSEVWNVCRSKGYPIRGEWVWFIDQSKLEDSSNDCIRVLLSCQLSKRKYPLPLTPLFSKAMCLSDNTMYATKPHLGTKFKTLCRIPRDANWRCFSKIAIA